MKNLIREEINTNRPIVQAMIEYVDGNNFLSDHRFNVICEVYGEHEDGVIEQLAKRDDVDRVEDGFIFHNN